MSGLNAIDHAAQNGAAGATAPQPDRLGDVTSKDAAEAAALKTKLQANEDAGARVMNFDEEATPEEKAAQAKAAKEKIKPKKPQKEDTGSGELQPPLPPG